MLQACRKSSVGKYMMVMMTVGVLLFAAWAEQAKAAIVNGVELYTPYLEMSAPPGETVSYSIQVINRGASTASVELSFDTFGHDWEYQLSGGGNTINKLAILPDGTERLSLQLHVPLAVEKGRYNFQLNAGGSTLPIAVEVSEQGTFRSELTVDQPNMQGHADSTFTFSASLRNRTAEKQTYALTAQMKQGWMVDFTADGKSVTSVEVEPNNQKSVSIRVTPPVKVEAGTYEIPIIASNSATTAETVIEAVVTGTYSIELRSADDRLSSDITAGSERILNLVIANTGTAELKDINLTTTRPSGWEVSFEPATIESLAAGEQANVQATIKSDKKALPGDYVVNITSSSPEKSSSAQIRMSVKSSVLWSWVGILIIAAVVAGIYYLMRKFGRR